MLGMTEKAIERRIADNSQLRALYQSTQSVKGIEAPTQGQVLNRKPDDLPQDPTEIELVQLVSETENELHQLGLKKLGLSDKLLKRLKRLDGLASSSGAFIAISLEKTHRSYYVQLLELMEMAEELRVKLMIPRDQPGAVVDDEARAFFNKNYIEMVREAGRGYEMMLTGATAMVKMIGDAKGLDIPGGKKKKAGWGIVDAPKRKGPLEPMPS